MANVLETLVKGLGDVEGGIQHAARGVAKVVAPAKAVEPVNTKYAKIIQKAGEKQGINPAYLWGVVGTESNYGQNAVKGGPFQFEPATAKEYGYPLGVNEGVGSARWSGVTNIKAFEQQAEAAAKLLKANGINKNPNAALEKYNSGKAGGDAVYVNKVLTHAKTFASWFGVQEEHEKTVEKTEENPWSPTGEGWNKILEIGLTLVIVIAGALLLVYGVAVAVRPREKAFHDPGFGSAIRAVSPFSGWDNAADLG